MDELDSGSPKTHQVELGAPTPEIVEGNHMPVRMALRQRHRDIATNESGAARHQDPHLASLGWIVGRRSRFPTIVPCRRSSVSTRTTETPLRVWSWTANWWR